MSAGILLGPSLILQRRCGRFGDHLSAGRVSGNGTPVLNKSLCPRNGTRPDCPYPRPRVPRVALPPSTRRPSLFPASPRLLPPSSLLHGLVDSSGGTVHNGPLMNRWRPGSGSLKSDGLMGSLAGYLQESFINSCPRDWTGEMQSPGSGPFFGENGRNSREVVARKHGPDPFVLDFAPVRLWTCVREVPVLDPPLAKLLGYAPTADVVLQRVDGTRKPWIEFEVSRADPVANHAKLQSPVLESFRADR